MKKIIAGLFFLTSSAFAASNIGVVQGDAVTFSSMVVTGNVTMNGTCTGTGCGSGGGGTNGNIVASPQNSVGFYSGSGTTTTVQGFSSFQFNGTSVTVQAPLQAGTLVSTGNVYSTQYNVTGGVGSVGIANGGIGITSPQDIYMTAQSSSSVVLPAGTRLAFIPENSNGRIYIAAPSSNSVNGTQLSFILPGSSGTASQFMQTDGNGNLSWASQAIPSINSAGNSAIVSSVTFAAIGSAALSQVGNTITISASGGGASSLGVNYNGVSVTTPTAQINALFPLRATANSSTATLTLDNLSLSTGPFSGQLPATLVATGNLGAGVVSSSAAVNSITPTALSAGAYPNITGLGPITSSVTFNGAAGGSDLYISSNVAVFTTYVDSNTSTAQTINWNLSNRHYSRLTGNVTYTFIAPPAGANLFLDIDTGNGSFTATWPGSVIWAGGSAPTITTAANNYDKINCDYLEVKGKYLCAPVQAYH